MSAGGRSEQVHRYAVRCMWSGSTAGGYDAYDRTHTGRIRDLDLLELSGDASFGGSSDLANPEELLLLAAASCQLLSFLAVAARARIDVRDYVDDAAAVMPEDDLPLRVTRIVLRPAIRVGPGTDEAQVRHLVEVAHRECFIARSLRSEVDIEPRISVDIDRD
jgi:organic hydroperoxide reductase OsmC/OhrA